MFENSYIADQLIYLNEVWRSFGLGPQTKVPRLASNLEPMRKTVNLGEQAPSLTPGFSLECYTLYVNKLYIFCGIPFSGKSTISKQIAQRPNYVRIDLDEVKEDLLGKDIRDESISQTDWDRVYQETYKRIEAGLKAGKNVVQDAGNFTRYERGLVREIADKLGLETIVVYIDTPIVVARQRLLENKETHQRFEVSEESFDAGVKEMESPINEGNLITYKNDDDLNSWIEKNFVS